MLQKAKHVVVGEQLIVHYAYTQVTHSKEQLVFILYANGSSELATIHFFETYFVKMS